MPNSTRGQVHLYSEVVSREGWFSLAREVGSENPFFVLPLQSGFGTYLVCVPISEEQFQLFQLEPQQGEAFASGMHGQLPDDFAKLGYFEPVFDEG